VQYDAINGTPSCINGWMSNTVARETWGWEGTIYTDCGALRNVNAHFHKFQSGEHTAAVAIKQGTDLECDSVLKKNLGAALNHSLLDVEDLRVSASRYVRIEHRKYLLQTAIQTHSNSNRACFHCCGF
jgi:beta-glucosidase-like glycosyl hydrolase